MQSRKNRSKSDKFYRSGYFQLSSSFFDGIVSQLLLIIFGRFSQIVELDTLFDGLKHGAHLTSKRLQIYLKLCEASKVINALEDRNNNKIFLIVTVTAQ